MSVQNRLYMYICYLVVAASPHLSLFVVCVQQYSNNTSYCTYAVQHCTYVRTYVHSIRYVSLYHNKDMHV